MSSSNSSRKRHGASSGKDYEVGYGRPPVASRFKAGNPGNPTGRRKKKKTVGQIIHDAMMTRIRLEENGRSRTVTAQDVIILNLVRLAARSDLRAIRVLFALRERYQDSDATTLNPSDLEAEDRKIIEEHLNALRSQEPGAEPAEAQSPDTAEDVDSGQSPEGSEDDKP